MNTSPDRLYGTPGAEQLYLTAAEAYEHQIEPNIESYEPLVDPEAHALIEEHTVTPPRSHLPSVDRVLDDVVQWAGDNGAVNEWWYEDLSGHSADLDVIAAMDAALELLASKVGYFMSDKVVVTHRVTWDERGPLLDGDLMYVKAAAKADPIYVPGDKPALKGADRFA